MENLENDNDFNLPIICKECGEEFSSGILIGFTTKKLASMMPKMDIKANWHKVMSDKAQEESKKG